MRKLIVVLVLSTLACAQDMTVEQCRADQLLWSHQLDTHTGPRWSLPNLVGHANYGRLRSHGPSPARLVRVYPRFHQHDDGGAAYRVYQTPRLSGAIES